MSIIIGTIVFIFVFELILRTRADSHRADENLTVSPEQKIRQFLSDVTSNDSAALTAFEKTLKTPELYQNADQEIDFSGEYGTYFHITRSLYEADRMIRIDHAEGERVIFDYFHHLFELDNIKIPNEIEDYIYEKGGTIKRGQAPKFVVALIQATANKAGYEILHLDAQDDQYRFFLSPQDVAKKWVGKKLVKPMQIEIPQWVVPADFAEFMAQEQKL